MPSQVDQRFAEWSASPPSSGRLVEGVSILGNPETGARRYARGIFEVANLPDHNGDVYPWAPANIDLKLPDRVGTFDQGITVLFDGLRPDMVRAFDRLTPEIFFTTTYVRLYQWIVPTAVDAPMWNPPPKFPLESVKLSSSALELVCSAPVFPRTRAGRVFVDEQYPGLVEE